jgi:transposase
LAGVSLPTVDRWLGRYAQHGLAGLEEHKRGAGREQVPAQIPARILALTRTTPPAETGLSHWSSRELAAYVSRTEKVSLSWHYVAKLWRENDLKPHRQGTFKISRDPRFADKVFDVVGLYLDPPAGAVVLSLDEKTQVQAYPGDDPGVRDSG